MSGPIAEWAGDEPGRDLAAYEAGGDPSAVVKLLPEPFRRPVGFFWLLNRHLLPSPTPLVLRLQVWAAKEGLTAEEVRAVLNAVSAPERAAGHRFASDLLADLAGEVAAVVRRRRQREEIARVRAEAEAARAAAVPVDFRELLTRFSGGPDD